MFFFLLSDWNFRQRHVFVLFFTRATVTVTMSVFVVVAVAVLVIAAVSFEVVVFAAAAAERQNTDKLLEFERENEVIFASGECDLVP